MKIISIINRKGGVGKTTLSMHLAEGLRRKKFNPIVIDCDPQQSAKLWRDADIKGTLKFNVDVMKLVDAKRENLTKLYNNDIVIIDTPGVADNDLAKPIIAADLILIPLAPSALDVMGTAPILRRIQKYIEKFTHVKAALILVKVDRRANSLKSIEKALKGVSLPVLSKRLGLRQAYITAAEEGVTVYDLPRTQTVRFEVDAVVKEVRKLLK